jgi:hypothetical protein
MSTLADGRPARSGTCRIHLVINGLAYEVRRKTRGFPGCRVWWLRKLEGERAGHFYVVCRSPEDTSCTCPDFSINGARCKHIGALEAARLLARHRKGVARG